MGRPLLPRTLPELYAHALAMEREAAKRFAELEQLMRDVGLEHLAEEFAKIGREEKEQYELLALGTERRTQIFYSDVAEHSADDAVRAFAAEMAADEQRHVLRLELLLAREPE